MGKVTDVSVLFRRVIQAKQYEPVEASLAATVTVGPDEDPKEVIEKTYFKLREQAYELLAIDAKRKDQMHKKFRDL